MPAQNYTTTTVAVGTAGNDQNNEAAVAEYNGVVTGVTYTPNATITGATTNNRTFNLVNKGQTGVGTTVVATLTMANTVNATAGDEKAITLSATPANLVVAAGDVLEWQSVHNASGITDPGGLVKITIDRTYS